jgi:hypothetical protein
MQTHQILRWLGESEGVYGICPRRFLFLEVPYHINTGKQIRIKSMHLDQLICANLKGDRWKFEVEEMLIEKSIQFRSLDEGMELYEEYITTYRGTGLKDHYSVSKYQRMINGFSYLSAPYENSFIIVRQHSKEKKCYRVVEGLHRVSVLIHRGHTKALVAEIG